MTSAKKSDISRAFNEDGEKKTHIGGQALIEGVMMRGRYNWAVGVREPDGNIYCESRELASGQKKNSWLYWPLVRGCRAFFESLVIGYKALEIATSHAYWEDEDEDRNKPLDSVDVQQEPSDDIELSREDSSSKDSADESKFSWKRDFGAPDEMIDALGAQRGLEVVSEDGQPIDFQLVDQDDCECESLSDSDTDASLDQQAASKTNDESSETDEKPKALLSSAEMSISMILGLVLGVVLFVVLPAVLTNIFVGEYDDKTFAWNLVDGFVRIAIFVAYIWLIGRMNEMKRLFAYHGAEHKTIHCFEHGLPLTPENAKKFPRLHVRCGTAFLIMVMILAILIYSITPINALISVWGVPDGVIKLLLVIAIRIVLMPLIAGIAYEITVRWAGSHPEHPLVKVILWPGLKMQYLTTREPDELQLECAIAAMNQVLEREAEEQEKGVQTTSCRTCTSG